MQFQTKYTHEKSPGEVNLGKNLVEKPVIYRLRQESKT